MNALETVEFVGGPYDGYHQPLNRVADGLVRDAAVPVSVNTILAVNGEEHGPLLPCSRLALYHLRLVDGSWQYHFQGVMACSTA